MEKTKKEYRTQKQFDEIIESVIHGNFNQAVRQYIDYGCNAQLASSI